MDKPQDIISKQALQDKTDTPVLNSTDIINPKNEKAIKKKRPFHLIWAFALPFFIMLAIYAAMGAYPFGKSSVLVLDLNGQYVYFFEALRDIVWGDGSLFYSFSRAMGGEFLGIYAYYLASPLSYIVALFPQHMILEALYLILILKCGLSGLSFCYYLYKNNVTKNRAAQVMFSCMYALSAYGIVMQHNTMWFDCVALLPLVALGTEKLIKERKYKIFTLSLALSVISNFYIGYMVCIFVFIYFFFYYFSRSKREINPLGERLHFVRSISRVGIFSAIAIAISACILLPALYSLTFGKNTFSDPNYFPTQKFDFFDILTTFFPGSYDTVRPEGLPLLYCGLIAVIFVPLFFISKHINKREKIASGILAVLFVLFFNLSTIDMFWHGMQRPNWLNYRYSFMLIFFILTLGCKAFDRLSEINPKVVLGICSAAAVVLFIAQKLGYDNVRDFACVWLSIAFLCIYAVGIPLAIKSKFKITSTMILCVFVCLELFVSGLLNLVFLDEDVVISSYDSYHGFIDNLRPIINEVEESDDSFYRMEKNVHRKVNDPMALGIRGFSNSTSTLNQSTIAFLDKMGLASQSHWSKYMGSTPVFDSLFGVKYLIAKDSDNTVSKLYQEYKNDADNSYIAYKNPYALSIAYGVNSSIKDIVLHDPNELLGKDDEPVEIPEGYLNVSSPIERYNAILGSMLGKEGNAEIFKPITYSVYSSNATELFVSGGHKKYTPEDSEIPSIITYKLNVEQDGEIYCYFPTDYPREAKINVNGKSIGSYFNGENYRVLSLGYYEAGEALTVTLTLKSDDLYIIYKTDYFFYLDQNAFEEAFSMLSEGQLIIDKYTEDSFKGTITLSDGMNTVFTTIPYDKGWNVYADGEKVETFEVLESVIGFDLSAGEHEIYMYYRSDAMVYGAVISAIGLSLFILIIIFEKPLKKLYIKLMPKDIPADDMAIGITADYVIEDYEIDAKKSRTMKI